MTKLLTIEQVAHFPRPGTEGPRRFEFTPDSASLLYLDSAAGSLVQHLWSYELASGERRQLGDMDGANPAQLSREEELLRERTRTRELGITDFQVASQATPLAILVSLGGWLYFKQGEAAFRRLEGSQGALNARLSPDGRRVAFVRQNNLYLLELDQARSSVPLALTGDSGEGLTNGVAEYIAQEEMHRLEGFWWSPDSRRIVFERADSRHIPLFSILHQGQSAGRGEIEEHRYPFTGEANDKVELGIIDLPVSGLPPTAPPVRWLDLNLGETASERPAPLENGYLARVDWRPDGALAVQLESRDQRGLRLVIFYPQKGHPQVLLEEQGQPWLNLHDLTHFLKSGEILLGSERSGYRHLYLYDGDGREVRQLTAGDWLVTEVNRLDEKNRLVYFTATKDSPLERQLYVVSLDGGEPARLTGEAGWHTVEVSPDGQWLVDRWSSLENPASVSLSRIEGGRSVQTVTTLYEDASVSPFELGLRPPELVNFPAEDGTVLYGAIYHPGEGQPAKPYPLIMAVYGGPGAQRVQNNWDLTVDLRAQYLAQQGFVVFKVDNRGSANRGLAFEGVLAGRFGEVELQDQLAGVKFLTGQGLVDAGRVGIYGWSYGGYMTCMALFNAPEVFKVGVAGAPVTFWEGYDTHYTERYLGTPQANPAGYQASAALPYAAGLTGKLLLVHGLVDENVHFRHSAALLERLTEELKNYDLLLFPEERHMPRKAATLAYLEKRITDFFKDNL
jgi:dipeptidyl-peptidase 4